MTPKRHKNRLLKILTQLREQVCLLYEHEHVKHPSKSLKEVELDIHDLTMDIEKMELSK